MSILSERIELIRQVNRREEGINAQAEELRHRAYSLLAEMMLSGHDLMRIRGLDEKSWTALFHEGQIKFTARRALTYISCAKRKDNSFRQALLVFDPATTDAIEDEAQAEDRTKWSDDVAGIGRVTKLVGWLTDHAWDKWPQVSKTRLRDELLPMARHLWPERFTK